MTAKELERSYLSLRCWLQRVVLPSAALLTAALIVFKRVTSDPSILNHNAVIVGFFILYFVLVRGGHLIMIRSLHNEMMRKYKEAYKDRLAAIPRDRLRRHNLGFTLARIKRDLITEYGVK